MSAHPERHGRTGLRVSPPVHAASSVLLQRSCACGQHTNGQEECASCRNRRLQRRVSGWGGPALAPPIVHDVIRTAGHGLDRATRDFFEARFGHDFSRVRVHADARAAESARAVGALAYTVESHVVFGAGRYAPQTMAGRRLLAHELTHVAQQAPGLNRQADIIPTGPIDTSGPGLERAKRYRPRLRPHVPQAPPISPPPIPQEEHPRPATCPTSAEVTRELRASSVRADTEAEMQRQINLGRSLAGLALPATRTMIALADRAIRAEFGRLLPSGRNFASPASVTMRTPREFSELRVPDEAAARRRIGEVALEVATGPLHDLCIDTPTHATLEREVTSPLLTRHGLAFVREFDRTRIGGQTRFPTVGGSVQPHVDLPSASRNMGHIVVHEAMHFYAHPVYQQTAEAGPLERELMEGGAEFLARHVINARLASHPHFRIHAGTYAAARGYVADHLIRGGVATFALAYFQGRVDLLGLTPPGGRAAVQPRLAVGPSHDPAEREADRMAEWVTSGAPMTGASSGRLRAEEPRP
jgi:hypothetical protein